ncbi:MAG: hypothetical protein HC848_09925 [Limnobacter sp.]|nr:hypothetical protein [Limnobacter sp.]
MTTISPSARATEAQANQENQLSEGAQTLRQKFTALAQTALNMALYLLPCIKSTKPENCTPELAELREFVTSHPSETEKKRSGKHMRVQDTQSVSPFKPCPQKIKASLRPSSYQAQACQQVFLNNSPVFGIWLCATAKTWNNHHPALRH